MKTINFRAYRTHPHAPAYIFVGVLVVLILLNAAAEWRGSAPALATPTPALIRVFSTREPQLMPTTDPRLAEIDALKARLAELEARQQSAPAAEPDSDATYRQMSVEQAAPTATPYHADPPITYSEAGSTTQIKVPEDAPRYCTGFGDWRDYDAMYAASPACHATP